MRMDGAAALWRDPYFSPFCLLWSLRKNPRYGVGSRLLPVSLFRRYNWYPMTAPRIDLCMVGKARVAQSRAATRNYVFTVLPDRWTALQCNMSEQMKRPLEELHHCDCTILISRWMGQVKDNKNIQVFSFWTSYSDQPITFKQRSRRQ